MAALVGDGFTFDEVGAMTLPQIVFAASGGKPHEPRVKFDTFEDYALWRKEL